MPACGPAAGLPAVLYSNHFLSDYDLVCSSQQHNNKQDRTSNLPAVICISQQQSQAALLPLQVVPVLQEQVATWRAMLPVAAALRNPQLQERHWQKVAAVLGDGLQPTEPGFTFQTLLERQVCPQVLPGQLLAPCACLSIGCGALHSVGRQRNCSTSLTAQHM